MFDTSHQIQSISSPFKARRATTLFTVAALAVCVCVPAHAAVVNEGGATTATPGGTIASRGTRVAVISATDTQGDALAAQRALLAAEIAVNHTRGMLAVPRADVVAAMNKNSGVRGTSDSRGPNMGRGATDANAPFGEPVAGDTRLPVDIMDIKALGKSTKAPRALSVFVTRGDSDAGSATVRAVAELYDTTSGGLVGRGESTFTSTVAAAATTVPNTRTGLEGTARTAPATADARPIVDGVAYAAAARAEAAQVRALSGAVYRAVNELNRPIELRGAVISIPDPYRARISFGEQKGIRNGARIEYVSNGVPVAYGTVTDVGFGEAVATVAPEAAFAGIYVNMEVRNVSNPVASRAGETEMQSTEREFRRFERDFGIAAVVAGVLLYTYTDAQLFS